MKIKVKKLHEDAVLPKSANETDAGFDLVAIDDGEETETYIQYRTGIAVQPDPGYHTELFPRSSISKTDLMLANGIGCIDNLYTGEVIARFKVIPHHLITSIFSRLFWKPKKYKKGDKIAQLVIRKTELADFQWVKSLSETSRGGGGFGSTDVPK